MRLKRREIEGTEIERWELMTHGVPKVRRSSGGAL
jgi:hypothetical protein